MVDDENVERVVGTFARASEQLQPKEWHGKPLIASGGTEGEDEHEEEGQRLLKSSPPVVQAGHVTVGLKMLSRVPSNQSAIDFDIWLPARPPPPTLHLKAGLRPSGALELFVVGERA